MLDDEGMHSHSLEDERGAQPQPASRRHVAPRVDHVLREGNARTSRAGHRKTLSGWSRLDSVAPLLLILTLLGDKILCRCFGAPAQPLLPAGFSLIT